MRNQHVTSLGTSGFQPLFVINLAFLLILFPHELSFILHAMSSISQILRFTLPRSATRLSAFQELRQCVSAKASIKTQYFGYVLPDQGFPVPKPENEMCWLIRKTALLIKVLSLNSIASISR
jgi:hypothetical protein